MFPCVLFRCMKSSEVRLLFEASCRGNLSRERHHGGDAGLPYTISGSRTTGLRLLGESKSRHRQSFSSCSFSVFHSKLGMPYMLYFHLPGPPSDRCICNTKKRAIWLPVTGSSVTYTGEDSPTFPLHLPIPPFLARYHQEHANPQLPGPRHRRYPTDESTSTVWPIPNAPRS